LQKLRFLLRAVFAHLTTILIWFGSEFSTTLVGVRKSSGLLVILFGVAKDWRMGVVAESKIA
jgi:hypothetical protein